MDIELEKGTYFLARAEKRRLKNETKVVTSEAVSKKRQAEKRAVAFVEPSVEK